jgi:hypothetical protein
MGQSNNNKEGMINENFTFFQIPNFAVIEIH